ncbi:MAG: cupredoxin domain-containing protein [Actinomycetota bacterium]
MRRLIIGLAGVLSLGGLTACSSSGSTGCEDPVATTSVRVVDFAYDPACVAADPDATIEVSNTDEATHTFNVSGTDAAVEVGAGETGEVDLTGVAPGTYGVFCTYHPDMEAEIRIG